LNQWRTWLAHFQDVTLRLELGDLFLQGRDLGQFQALLAIAGDRRGWRHRRFTHPPPQHTLCQFQIPACLGHRHAPLGHELHRLELDLAAEFPSRHIQSPVPWSRSYLRVHGTGSRPLLDTIAEGELANRGNIAPEWADPSFDPGRQHSIPYQWGSTSFAVNRDVYDGDINTTDILFDPPAELSGRINMLDSQGEVLAMAALHMGIPQCSNDRDQLSALNAMLQEAKQHWASFNSDTAKEVLVSGDVAVGQIYDGFSAKAREEGANVEYAFPAQGYVVWMDNVVLLQDAPNRENALLFMDFLLEPENIAAVTNYARYNAGLTGVEAFLDPSLAEQPESTPPAEAGAGVFIEVCDQATQEVYDQIWINLKK